MSSSAYRRIENLRALWPWLPLWTLAALLSIFSHPPLPLYSTRTLAVAWEMWSHGHWLVPYLNGAPYSEKTPLLFWLIHLGWGVFGVNDIWPRLLEVAFGGTELILLMLLARRTFPNRPWVVRTAPWMLMSIPYIFLFDLQIMYDVLLTVWVLAALIFLLPTNKRQEPRWLLFGLCIGAGLLTKGPVMLLHILFPWLLGPYWSEWARTHRAPWYGHGSLAILLGIAILLAWAIPAGFAGGEAYRHQLFFTQTAARLIHGLGSNSTLQSHPQPVFWYLLMLPLLLLPLTIWPRAWVALAKLHRPWPMGLRFAMCWVIPGFIAFSLVSGKQLYYLLPELAGGILLLAAALVLLRERHQNLANHPWLSTWPIGITSISLGIFMLALPDMKLIWNLDRLHWLTALYPYSQSFSALFVLLGLLLLRRARSESKRLAFASLIATLALHGLFTLSLWQRYDLTPTTRLLADAANHHRAIGYVGGYDGQFHFYARLKHPITELYNNAAIADFAKAHPRGLIAATETSLTPYTLHYSLLVQPFRSSWMVVWSASTLAALRNGMRPPEPSYPPIIYDGKRRYQGAL